MYAFTIVIQTCLPPADRHIAAGVSWHPNPNPLVSLSSHPSFNGSVSDVSVFSIYRDIEQNNCYFPDAKNPLQFMAMEAISSEYLNDIGRSLFAAF